ncbi:unnamed protein product [Pleuronectes platessa]|uniref:MHC class I antigen n=1 Tax=Pleuronectes platessa TaxID=8262 RepID=A0A9N7U7H2_PLEPL|nr:unnamed protein product [Pleuronectes platessa]
MPCPAGLGRAALVLITAGPQAASSGPCLGGGSGIKSEEEQESRTEHRAQGRGGSRPSISGFRIQRVLTGLSSPGTGLWAVTTDTQTNQELSLMQYQLDRVTGDGNRG